MPSPTTIPGVRKPGLLLRKFLPEAVSALGALAASGVTTWRLALDPNLRNLAWTAGLSTALVAIGGAIRVRQALKEDGDEARQHDHEGLLGAVHVMHAVLSGVVGIGPGASDTLRITVHRVVPVERNRAQARSRAGRSNGPEEIEQLLPYTGGSGGEAGRRFSIRSGVTGRAVRTGRVQDFHLAAGTDADFVDEMVELGFTREDAATLSRGRNSYLAIPVHRRDKPNQADGVIAVIYLDSNRVNAFTDTVIGVALTAATGFFHYFNERY